MTGGVNLLLGFLKCRNVECGHKMRGHQVSGVLQTSTVNGSGGCDGEACLFDILASDLLWGQCFFIRVKRLTDVVSGHIIGRNIVPDEPLKL